jgi:hypothetical protein
VCILQSIRTRASAALKRSTNNRLRTYTFTAIKQKTTCFRSRSPISWRSAPTFEQAASIPLKESFQSIPYMISNRSQILDPHPAQRRQSTGVLASLVSRHNGQVPITLPVPISFESTSLIHCCYDATGLGSGEAAGARGSLSSFLPQPRRVTAFTRSRVLVVRLLNGRARTRGRSQASVNLRKNEVRGREWDDKRRSLLSTARPFYRAPVCHEIRCRNAST